MKRYTIPHFGDYTIALKALIDPDAEFVITTPTHRTIELGVRHSPEFICYPYKIVLGNMIENINLGATDLFMLDINASPFEAECRLAYYSLLQKMFLTEHKVAFHRLRIEKIVQSLKKELPDCSLFKIVNNIMLFALKTYLIDSLNTAYYRTISEGKKKVKDEILREIYMTNKAFGLLKVKKKIKKSFPQSKGRLRVAIIGEIYLIHETSINNDIAGILNDLGVEVDVLANLSHFILYSFCKKRMIKKYAKTSKEYLDCAVGGHGLDSVAHMIESGKYAGIIQILPFGCMPETSVRPILSKVASDKKINYLSLSLDQHAGKAGLETRLEAFVDMIRK